MTTVKESRDPRVRAALVTGANKGIGRAIAAGLLRASFTVYLGARDAGRGAAAAAGLAHLGDVRPLTLDVTAPASVAAAAGQIGADVGHLDVLVNNAGVSTAARRPLKQIPAPTEENAEDMRFVFETNVFAESLDIALAHGLQDEAGRAYSNLYDLHARLRLFAASESWFAEGLAYCDEHDLTSNASYLRGVRIRALERTGRWNEAVSLSRDLLASAGPSPLNRLPAVTMLGLIAARREEPGAWPYLDEAAETAELTGEPQWIVPARLARAEACWLRGEAEQARREAELADDVCGPCDLWERGEVAVWLQRTGSDRPPRGHVAGPHDHQLRGQSEASAQAWDELGCSYEAALARGAAAGEDSLHQALAAFQQLGATAATRLARRQMRTAGIRSIPIGPRAATRAIRPG